MSKSGAEEDQANYDAYADILILQYKVQTIYLYPDIATPDLETYIGTTGISMIGTVSPEQRPGRLGDDDPAGCDQGDPKCLARAGQRAGRGDGSIAPWPG